MIQHALSAPSKWIHYPESDGLPMADNTRQFNWIIVLATNLRALFHNDANVFVAGNQNWYPVEGEPEVCAAPDVYVVFGRPKGERGSYKQWEEGNVPMTVVFEVLSPSNTFSEMIDKLAFYEEHGAEEYYVYDPDNNRLFGYLRRGELLLRHQPMNGFVSPRLKIQFDLSGPELVVRYPDGRPFVTFEELSNESVRLTNERDRLTNERDQAKQRADRMAELSGKVLLQAATPEEVQELQHLIQAAP
jgi:Uma2 family endonuclease